MVRSNLDDYVTDFFSAIEQDEMDDNSELTFNLNITLTPNTLIAMGQKEKKWWNIFSN